MANSTNAFKQGLLLNNPSPEPDGSVGNYNIQTIALAGTTQLTAAGLTGVVNIVTGASGTNGGILQVGTVNQTVRVYSSAATNAALIYPPFGGTINSGTMNTSVSQAARKGVDYVAIDTTGLNWITIGL